MAFYVTMIDKFMSGWGEAKNTKAYYVVMCDTLEEAEAIEKAAQDRPEMKYITISENTRRVRYGQLTMRHVSELSGPWLDYMSDDYMIS